MLNSVLFRLDGYLESSRFRHSYCEDSNLASSLRGRRATVTLYSGLNGHLSNSPSSPRHRGYYLPQGFHKVPNESRQSVFGQNGRCYRFSSISFFTFELPPSRCLNGLGFYYNQWWEQKELNLHCLPHGPCFTDRYDTTDSRLTPKKSQLYIRTDSQVGATK